MPAALILFLSLLSRPWATRWSSCAEAVSTRSRQPTRCCSAPRSCARSPLTERDPSRTDAEGDPDVVYLRWPAPLTFGLYFWLLRFVDAHKLSLIAYVTPAIAIALGWTVGDEPVTRYTLAGGACILAGVVLVVRHGTRRK